jgi:ABC-type nitrate/sulfonate/bicarbonate transport system ATPase subunit
MASNKPKIRVAELTKEFRVEGESLPVVDDISFDMADGAFVCVVGPSGCGKSTLFNIMNGLVEPDSGQVLLDDQDITGKAGLLGYMPQKDLLFPWRTVLENSILGLELKGVPRMEAESQAINLFEVFGLSRFEYYYPSALSGGMRQRVSLARTFLFGADVMLLDEPFGALDALTRTVMQDWLQDVWGKLGHSILFITHDVEEAILLGDRVLVLSARPARVLMDVEVPLPRPRRVEHRSSPEALSMRTEILQCLQRETEQAFTEQAIKG